MIVSVMVTYMDEAPQRFKIDTANISDTLIKNLIEPLILKQEDSVSFSRQMIEEIWDADSEDKTNLELDIFEEELNNIQTLKTLLGVSFVKSDEDKEDILKAMTDKLPVNEVDFYTWRLALITDNELIDEYNSTKEGCNYDGWIEVDEVISCRSGNQYMVGVSYEYQ